MIRHICLIALLIAFGAILFGAGIGKRDLWSPDEPRFGQVMREMLQRHNYFTLYQNNKVYDDKPPLYIWLAAAINGGDGTSISNAAVRLPSVIGGIVGVVVTYLLGLFLFKSWKTALLSAAILATMDLYCTQANKAQLDMLMSAFSYIAIFCWWMANESSRSQLKILWWIGFWAAAALGTLSKGPPALIIPLGTIAFFLMFQYNPRKAAILGAAWAIVIFCIAILGKFVGQTALWIVIIAGCLTLIVTTFNLWIMPLWENSPRQVLVKSSQLVMGFGLFAAILAIWLIPYVLNAPKASHDTLVTQTLIRYFRGMSHQAWIGFFLEQIPSMLMPWTLYFIAGFIVVARKRIEMPGKQWLFLMTWMIFTLVFFSLSPAKRDQYLLPSIPAYALFTGWFISTLAKTKREELGRFFTIPAYLNALSAGCAGVGAIATWVLFGTSAIALDSWRLRVLGTLDIGSLPIASLHLWLPSILCIFTAIWLLIAARKRLVWQSVIVTMLFTATFILYRNCILYPAINTLKSGRIVSERIMALRSTPNTEIGMFDFYRDDFIVYGDYFPKEIPDNKKAKDGDPLLHQFMQKPEQVLLLMRVPNYIRLRKMYPDLPMRLLAQINVDNRDLAIVDNQPQMPGGIELKAPPK